MGKKSLVLGWHRLSLYENKFKYLMATLTFEGFSKITNHTSTMSAHPHTVFSVLGPIEFDIR